MRSINHIGIIRMRSGQIICVSYLFIVVEVWHDGVVVVDPHPIMSHGRRRSIPQWSHQNVLTHFEHRNTSERMTSEPCLGSPSWFELDRAGAQLEVSGKTGVSEVLVDSAFAGGAHQQLR
jgi:hypothetical protein